jgi:hypothetical protein
VAGGWWGGRVINAEVLEQLGDVALDRMDVRSGRRPPWRRREQRDRARHVVDLAAQATRSAAGAATASEWLIARSPCR